MSGTNTQDQTVNGRLHANNSISSGTHVRAAEQLLAGTRTATPKFPAVVGFESDPSTGAGFAAEIGSIGLLDSGAGGWYMKTGPGVNDWTLQAGSGAKLVGSPLILTPQMYPAQLASGATANWNPVDAADATITLDKVSVIRVNPDAGGSTLSGLVGQTPGTVILLQCSSGSGGTLTLVQESGGSSGVNRFNLPGDVSLTLAADEAISLVYDYSDSSRTPTTLRWRSFALAQQPPDFPLSPFVGDGSDGAHTVAGTEDLAGANRFYTDLNLPVGQTLITKGGLICCRGTFTLGGALRYHTLAGMNGGAGTVSTGGGGGGGSFPNTYCGTGANGSAGVTNGTNGNAGNGAGGALSTWPGLVAGSVAGGAAGANGSNGTGAGMGGSGGGAGAGQSGGASGSVGTNSPAGQGSPHIVAQLATGRPIAGAGATPSLPWACGSSGGSGGAQAGTGASGGAGGCGGTIIVLCTKFVDAGGTINAPGGDAGACFAGTSAGVGGSAGGGGGVIVFISFGKGQGTPSLGNCNVAGGAGAVGAGAGKNGGNGIGGLVFKLNASV